MEQISTDELHSLWIHAWSVLRADMNSLDRGCALSAITDARHPFWARVRLALEELKVKQTFLVLETGIHIRGNNGRTIDRIVESLRPDWKRVLHSDNDARAVLEGENPTEKESLQEEEIVLVVGALPTQAVEALAEMARLGVDPAQPGDALKVIEAKPGVLRASNIGGANHKIVFINKIALAQSVELGYDAMGFESMAVVNVAEVRRQCFAARRVKR